MYKYLLLFLIILLSSNLLYAESVTVSWEYPDDDRVTGVYIYWGLTEDLAKQGNNKKEVSAPNNSTTIDNFEVGKTYYFTATSHDDSNNESDFSEVVDHTVKLGSPKNVNIEEK